MNKHILMLLLLANSTLAYAAPYAGLNIGESFTATKNRLSIPVPNNTPSVATAETNYTGIHIQALVGYDFHAANKWDIGIEGDVDYSSDSAHTKVKNWFLSSNATAETKLNYGYGIFILPKYRYDDNIRFFMGPGFAQGKFFARANAQMGINNSISGSHNKWLSAFGLKAGADVVVTPHLNFLLTYEYMNFDDVKWTQVGPLFGQVFTVKHEPVMNAVMVGLIWHA